MTDNSNIPVVVLGAGPAGLGAALQLARRGGFQVTVLEKATAVGGNAGSFELDGLRLDYGSHRLHPSCSPEILADIKGMLGEDLLDRPRHGRILLRGRWVHFPLKPLNLATHLPPDFLFGVIRDKLPHTSNGNGNGHETFASMIERGLGKTICRDFYFPYARKIWGLPPTELDAEQARRRVSASSVAKLVRKALNSVPGFKPPGSGRFFYPRKGFGQISEAYRAAAERAGAGIRLGMTVTDVCTEDGCVTGVRAKDEAFPAKLVLSTIPLTQLAKMMHPAAPDSVMRAASSLSYRSMILIYLELAAPQFTEYDAHYFPGADVAITRLSEPKNYSLAELNGRTVLCAELPCSTSDWYWSASDDQLRDLVLEALKSAGLPVSVPVLRTVARRLPQAYPIYTRDYRRNFDAVDEWIQSIDGLVTMGRQGLFAHDNTHHTLAMAYAAVSCLDQDGRLIKPKWAGKRREFESHVVED